MGANGSYECPLGAPKQSDGDYFENYGASTALELAWPARNTIKKKKGMSAVNLIIIQISGDPTKSSVGASDHYKSELSINTVSGTPRVPPKSRPRPHVRCSSARRLSIVVTGWLAR
jgi:hypothetical protein